MEEARSPEPYRFELISDLPTIYRGVAKTELLSYSTAAGRCRQKSDPTYIFTRRSLVFIMKDEKLILKVENHPVLCQQSLFLQGL